MGLLLVHAIWNPNFNVVMLWITCGLLATSPCLRAPIPCRRPASAVLPGAGANWSAATSSAPWRSARLAERSRHPNSRAGRCCRLKITGGVRGATGGSSPGFRAFCLIAAANGAAAARQGRLSIDQVRLGNVFDPSEPIRMPVSADASHVLWSLTDFNEVEGSVR